MEEDILILYPNEESYVDEPPAEGPRWALYFNEDLEVVKVEKT